MLTRGIKAADAILSGIVILIITGMLLYGGYSLWDTAAVYRNAYLDDTLKKIKPTDQGGVNPSLEELKKINPQVCAWIRVDQTHIDYPVVQGSTNTEYLNKDVYGEFSYSGTLFLDTRNHNTFEDSYSLIYGHHMEHGAMFGNVDKFRDETYFEEHPTGTLYLDGRKENILFFACVKADAADERFYTPENETGQSLQSFVAYIREHAVSGREMEFGENDRIIGLSTCSNTETNGRVILFGKLSDVR